MRSFQQKGGFRNILQSRPVLALLVFFVVIFGYTVVGFMVKMIVTEQNRKVAEIKVADLKKMKERLGADISKLNTGGGVEESIRGKFGLAKEGERLIVVIDNKSNVEVQEEESGGFIESLFFWKNWFK